ncbi:LamG domain-containing protein [Streptomyces somaliensis]|uniref:LamG domain-containing protein n=1 Tax=Streptomyces somaliensis TaxID=78355 RepID=UPI0034E94429|nr:LamG domain-containing protein [Streptomyces somaliensis]MCP9973757.1 LamG domain-containing protein [Streptomyces somaliensis]
MPTRIRRSPLLRGAAVTATASAVLAAGLIGLPGPDRTVNTGTGTAARAVPGQAATEETAKDAARKSGKRVEVLGLRGERRDVFAEPDGTFTAREYTEPVRAVRNGGWVGVDTTLVRRADGTVVPKATTVDLAFSSGEAGRPFATLRRAGREFALTWPYGKLPAPVLKGDTATYPDALPGVDLTVRAESDGFAHLLVVKTPEAAKSPRLTRVDLGMKTRGLKITKDASGALKAEDAAVGGTVFQAGKPSMWDSASVEETTARPQGSKAVARALTADDATAPVPALEGPGGGGRTAPLGIELGKNALRLIPDRDLLTGPGTVFPVVIDPIQRTTSRSAWTGVMSGMPTEQDWKYSDGAGVGRCPTDYNPVSCNGVGVRRVMFTVPTSFYKGKQILGATFSARVTHIYQAQPTAMPVQLYRIGGANHTITSSSDWSNTSTQWADHLQTVSRAISPTSCSSQANLHFESGSTGELTNQVRTAASGGWSSMSLGLRAEDESTFSQWKRVCGNAYLSVSYNTLPSQITGALMSSNPGGGCRTGTARPYTEVPPKLYTEARDPDHANGLTDKVKVQFKVEWVDATGVAKSYTADSGYMAPVAGTKFWHQVSSAVPQNRVVSWSVRAFDGDGWGPWSAAKCEFVYDATLPGKPNVLSEGYPADSVWHDGVGTYGTFTFSPNRNDSIPDTDVVKYRYAFDSTASPATTVAPAAPGGPASVQWMPTRPGPHWLEVVAVDKAENPSTVHRYEFNVSEGKAAAAQWSLADPASSAEAHDERESFSASAGDGVTFGVEGPGGRVDSAARLDGTAGAYLDAGATVLDTAGGFSVSAWARPTDLGRDMTVVSQDGTGEPGFTLGYNAIARTWAFSIPRTDAQSIGEWRAAATGLTVVKDQWVLLTGVYDAQRAQLQLYVNQTLKGSSPRLSPWRSYGPLQIGRSTARTGYRDNFTGDLAEIRVFDRVLPATQIAELMTVKPERKGYWQLDAVTDGASPEIGGGTPLQLDGDAHVYRPADPVFDEAALVGDGHLVLDGEGDHAATATPPVTGGASFTVTARVQLTSLDATAPQTVLSLPGTNANRLAVRYRPGSATEPSAWELTVARSDEATAEVRVFRDTSAIPDDDGAGQHLAVVYDAFANEIRLYVNGQLAGAADRTDDTLWPATRGLQVGRSLIGDSEYFAGAVDEVRVYSGAADTTAVQKMALLAPLTDI